MREVLRHLPAVVFECELKPDADVAFTFVSENCGTILGIPEPFLRDSQHLFSLIHKDESVNFRKEFLSSNGKQGSRKILTRLYNGRTVEFHYSEQILSEEQRLVRSGTITPVEPTIDSASSKLMDRLPLGVVGHSGGIISHTNDYAKKLICNGKSTLVGKPVDTILYKDDAEKILDRSKSLNIVETRFVNAEGKLLYVEALVLPAEHEEASARIYFRDISDRKAIEANVRKNETLLTQLFQSVPMAVVKLDEEGKVSEVNRGFEIMFGFDREELRGKNLNDVIVPPELRNEGIDLNNLISSNQIVSIESIRTHRSGKLINVILYGVPVVLDNEAIGIYGVYVDISEHKRLEEELKIRNSELDNFVYKVSHDLRAPLSSVLGLVNLSKMPGNNDDPRQYIDIIGRKVQSLDSFIGDVLSHSKNLKIDIQIGKVELKSIIEQTFEDLSYLSGAPGVKRSIEIEGDDFYSDQWRISEIFRNLISNAIKYRKPGARDSLIEIRVNVDRYRADIRFFDNGIGIKESDLKKVFEMFYRATDQGEGSGIGLYIVKNAVEKLGGQIKVSSQPGEGTRFHIVLPNKIHGSTALPANPQL